MTEDTQDAVVFDDVVAVALAELAAGRLGKDLPRRDVRDRLLARIAEPSVPDGFAFQFERDGNWRPHPVPGIRMRVLALDRARGCATLLLDVAPDTRFPPHHHTGGAEECYVVSGSLYTCGRHFVAGDFIHADAETGHGELHTVEGCRVLLVVPPEPYMQ